MQNGLLFISVFNLGGIELALNHLESLKRQNIENYMAYVTDQECYNIVFQKGYRVELLNYEDITKEKADFGTVDFNDLSYIRYKVIEDLLVKGQPVWYLDIDTVVLQNLNDVYDELKYSHYAVALQDDINMFCTGCMLLFQKPITLKLVKSIYSNKSNTENDQIILFKILTDNPKKIKILKLNKFQFPNGLLFFNELNDDIKLREIQLSFAKSEYPIYLVHANWMVGIETKIDAFKRKELWFI